MLTEFAQVPLGHLILAVIAVAFLTHTLARHCRKVRRGELEFALQRDLLERGYPARDIERLVRVGKGPPRVVVLSPAEPPEPGPPPSPAGAPPASAESASPGEAGSPSARQPKGPFGAWYRQRVGRLPILIQIYLWLNYGFVWIPLWYTVSRTCQGSTAAGPSGGTGRPGAVFAACTGVGLAFFGLFSGISLLVHVASSSSDSDLKRRLQEGEKLTCERRVVPVPAGGSGSCRVGIGREFFFQWDYVDLSAVVIGQSNPDGKLEVDVTPDRVNLGAPGPFAATVRLRPTAGTGDFTVQVKAWDRFNHSAETVFTVQVRPPAPGGSPGLATGSPVTGPVVLAVGAGPCPATGWSGIALALAVPANLPRGSSGGGAPEAGPVNTGPAHN